MLEILHNMRKKSGEKLTLGLSDDVIVRFLQVDPRLGYAIKQAGENFERLQQDFSSMLKKSEKEQIAGIQENFINFYADNAINPYVALAAKGPWIVSTCGAVIYDTGGYGMLGFGHSPDFITDALAHDAVMANIMTANFEQFRFVQSLRQEIGRQRKGSLRHPFSHFIAMNSGSEAMTVAARISDINALKLTSPGGRHAGRRIKFLALRGGFHGRTERPAQASDSSRQAYAQHLATFKGLDNVVFIEPNDLAGLEKAFSDADRDSVFFEIMFMEPVMGEGNPGLAATPQFFSRARELTKKMGTLLIVDSIQAGIRAHGCLSVCDYPGFEEIEGPDMESYSKALNAGQYPLSVLAIRPSVASLYAKGVYGNTMTGNPRALSVACSVLEHLTAGIRINIRERGVEFVSKLRQLQGEFPEVITGVQGTGLLVSCEIERTLFDVVGWEGIETTMRKQGVGVIHGGINSLRFTPPFDISSAEIDLVVDGVRKAIKTTKRKV